MNKPFPAYYSSSPWRSSSSVHFGINKIVSFLSRRRIEKAKNVSTRFALACIKRMRFARRTRSDLELGELAEIGCLGIGSFSRVTLVRVAGHSTVFALKRMKKSKIVKKRLQQHVMREKSILSLLDSPFCVKFHGTLCDSTSVYILNPLLVLTAVYFRF